MIRPIAVSRQIRVTVNDCTGEPVIAHVDRQRLRQILLNLCSNAVKYNRPGGNARVSCAVSVEWLRPHCGARQRLRHPEGQAAAAVHAVRAAWRRTDRRRRHGTRDSRSASASRRRWAAPSASRAASAKAARSFSTCRRPRTGRRRQCPASPATVPPPPAIAASGQVLYIEDTHANVRLMHRLMARRPGVQLLHAPDGETGLRLFAEHQPPLVLLDLHLPDMSGEEILRRIREQRWPSAEDRRPHRRRLGGAEAAAARHRRQRLSDQAAERARRARAARRHADQQLRSGHADSGPPSGWPGPLSRPHVSPAPSCQPPAIAPITRNGSVPPATASGSGASGESCDRSCLAREEAQEGPPLLRRRGRGWCRAASGYARSSASSTLRSVDAPATSSSTSSLHARQRAQMERQHHADHGSVCTSTESTGGRLLTIADQLSPASAERVHLAARGAEVDAARIERVDRHRIAQHVHVAVLLRQPLGQRLPRLATGPAAIDLQLAVQRKVLGVALDRHDVDRLRLVRVHVDHEAEIGRQVAADFAPQSRRRCRCASRPSASA